MKVAGTWRYRYRAVDQFGQVIDVLVALKRGQDGGPAVLHRRAGRGHVADGGDHRSGTRLPVVEDLLPGALHMTVKYVNNRVEADHGRSRPNDT